MNTPKPQPPLPSDAPSTTRGPHPLNKPDERKEGGDDFGKEDRQHRQAERLEREAEDQAKQPD